MNERILVWNLTVYHGGLGYKLRGDGGNHHESLGDFGKITMYEISIYTPSTKDIPVSKNVRWILKKNLVQVALKV